MTTKNKPVALVAQQATKDAGHLHPLFVMTQYSNSNVWLFPMVRCATLARPRLLAYKENIFVQYVPAAIACLDRLNGKTN
ncbi:MAG TPA: hypothetical protein DEP95_04020 [Candidatus Staskawiczbacteria bacterium]|nr:hypothetical protein [Candidatus Staskawiczbacteria bacterium]